MAAAFRPDGQEREGEELARELSTDAARLEILDADGSVVARLPER